MYFQRTVNTHHCKYRKAKKYCLFCCSFRGNILFYLLLSSKLKLDVAMKSSCYVCPKKTQTKTKQPVQTVVRKKNWVCNKEYITCDFHSIYTTINIDITSMQLCTHLWNHTKVGMKSRCCRYNKKKDKVGAVMGVAKLQLGIENWFCITKRLMKREGRTEKKVLT